MQSIYRLQLCPREPIRAHGDIACLWNIFYLCVFSVPEGDFYDLHFHYSVADLRQKAEKSADRQGFPSV